MIYWWADPFFYYSQLQSRSRLAKEAIAGFELIKEIERRYCNGFYHYDNVYFDPQNEDSCYKMHSFDFMQIDAIQEFPAIMYEATGPR